MSVATEREAGKKAGRPNLILGICCLSLLIVGMDVTIVNVALPAIEHDLHATLAALQWVVDAYTLVVASLLMLSGALSDRFGRRRVFQIGLVLFTAGSVLCSLAPTIGALVAFRAVQGLGASMLNPVALSIIANAFPAPKDRARAVGVWGAVAGVSLALGPLLGGVLTQTVGWRAIFWVNLPIGVVAVILAALFVPESKAERARAFDPPGQVLVFSFLTAVTFAVIEGPRRGWHSPVILGLFGLGALCFVGFLVAEGRRRQPMMDLRFFRSVPFSTAALLAMLAFASFAGFLFLNALYLQQVRGFSALRTGTYTLPLAVAMMVCAPLSGRIVGSGGTRLPLLLAGVGFLGSAVLLTGLSEGTAVWVLMVSYVLFGVGLGMVNPAITNNAVAGMPLSQAGVAAAIASTSRQVGAALGVAAAGTVVHASRAHGTDFARATHPVWWAIVVAGAVVLGAGVVSSTAWARGSTERVKGLLEAGA